MAPKVLKKKPSVMNMKIFSRKVKTWGPAKSKLSMQDSTDDGVAADDQTALRTLQYEDIRDDAPTTLKNPYEWTFTPAPSLSTTAVDSDSNRDDVSSKQQTSMDIPPLLNSPPPTPKLKGMKRIASLMRIRKAKTEPNSPSRAYSPTALKRITEPEEGIHASPTSSPTNSTYSPSAPTFAASTLAPTVPDTPITDIVEEHELADIKREIRGLKIADVASTQNALRLAYEARDTGIDTLTHLEEQGERIADAEVKILEAGVQNRIAGERIRELKHANKMVHVSNPFLVRRYEAQVEAEVLEIHQREREERDVLRKKRWEEALKKKVTVCLVTEGEGGQRDLIERAKYQFEPDSEDDEFEDRIEENLKQLEGVVPQLKELAVQMGEKVKEGNERLDGMRDRMDKVDDEMVKNRHALGRIH